MVTPSFSPEKILEKLSQDIGGDWLVVGGALVLLEYDAGRVTEDVDVAFLRHDSRSKEDLLRELYEELLRETGSGPELVNPAVEFFLGRLAGWRERILPWRHGKKGALYRPDLTLLCALKLQRASELDLSDLRLAIRKEGADSLDWKCLRGWLDPGRLKMLEELTR